MQHFLPALSLRAHKLSLTELSDLLFALSDWGVRPGSDVLQPMHQRLLQLLQQRPPRARQEGGHTYRGARASAGSGGGGGDDRSVAGPVASAVSKVAYALARLGVTGDGMGLPPGLLDALALRVSGVGG